MTQAVLLHTIQDAEHYVQNELFGDARLFSANINVVYYLKYRHNLECGDICSYLGPTVVRQINENMLQTSNELLRELDQQMAPAMNEQLGLSMRYFAPLYSFTAARQLALYKLLALALKRMIEDGRVDSAVLYEGVLGPLRSSVVDFFKAVFPNVKYYTISYAKSVSVNQTVISGLRLEKILNVLIAGDSSFRAFKQKITRQQGSDNETILLFEPFIPFETSGRNFDRASIYHFQVPPPTILQGLLSYELSHLTVPPQDGIDCIHSALAKERPSLILLYKVIRSDFCRNVVQYLQVCILYRKLHESNQIQQVYWENPPIQGARALVLEYFMTNKETTVTGIQAASTFFIGQIDAPYAVVSVFNRCHQFLHRNEIGENSLIEKNVLQRKKRQSVDIAVFLKPTLSFLETGQVANYTNQSKTLLEFLNQMTGKEVHVVTHPFPAISNCALITFLKTLENITLVNESGLNDYLKKYAPKLIFLDSSMPLLENVLTEDVPVLVMQDEIIFFSGAFMQNSTKTVYYLERIDEAKFLLQMYLNGAGAKSMMPM